jgi:hypothetical protein
MGTERHRETNRPIAVRNSYMAGKPDQVNLRTGVRSATVDPYRDEFFQNTSHAVFNINGNSYDKDYFSLIRIDGYREAGGPVDAGKNYIVGEKGPEILRMGNEAGTVIPNHHPGGQNAITVTVNNNVTIAAGSNPDASIVEQVREALNELAEADFRAEAGILKD